VFKLSFAHMRCYFGYREADFVTRGLWFHRYFKGDMNTMIFSTMRLLKYMNIKWLPQSCFLAFQTAKM